MLPIVACTTFGLYTSAVSGLHTMVSMPNQSAMRMMVPRLPGSCTPSSASTSFLLMLSAVSSSSVCLKTASTCCGFCCKLVFVSSSSVTTISSSVRCASSWCCCTHSSVATMVKARCLTSMSPTVLGPSATNTPSVFRFFFKASALMCFILFLLIIIFLCKSFLVCKAFSS